MIKTQIKRIIHLNLRLSFYHDFLGHVHTLPQKPENAALFLRLCLPSTLIRHENAAFQKRPSNRKNMNTSEFRFRLHRKHLKRELFENCDLTIIVRFPWPSFFFKLKSKPTVNCYVFKFLRHSVNGKCLMPIQSETSVFNFFWRSADPAPNISVEKLNCQNNPPSLNFNFDSN